MVVPGSCALVVPRLSCVLSPAGDDNENVDEDDDGDDDDDDENDENDDDACR